MSHYGKINFTGESGKSYPFEVYTFDTEFRRIPAVYIISTRYLNTKGSFSHKVIYIGHTEALLKKFETHPKLDCLIVNEANAISILPEGNRERRIQIVNDLSAHYTVLCKT